MELDYHSILLTIVSPSGITLLRNGIYVNTTTLESRPSNLLIDPFSRNSSSGRSFAATISRHAIELNLEFYIVYHLYKYLLIAISTVP